MMNKILGLVVFSQDLLVTQINRYYFKKNLISNFW
jgi:hypothetical protein